MKRIICAAVAAALLSPVLWTGVARAQDEDAAPPEHSEPAGPRMAKRLGLTDEQSAKFRDAMKAHGDALKEDGRQMRDAVKKLADGVKAKASDDAILAALTALKTTRKAMADENEKLEANLASFLTPTQRAKLALGMARMMHRRREEMKGRKDGDRRRPGEHGVDAGKDHGGPPNDGEGE